MRIIVENYFSTDIYDYDEAQNAFFLIDDKRTPLMIHKKKVGLEQSDDLIDLINLKRAKKQPIVIYDNGCMKEFLYTDNRGGSYVYNNPNEDYEPIGLLGVHTDIDHAL